MPIVTKTMLGKKAVVSVTFPEGEEGADSLHESLRDHFERHPVMPSETAKGDQPSKPQDEAGKGSSDAVASETDDSDAKPSEASELGGEVSQPKPE